MVRRNTLKKRQDKKLALVEKPLAKDGIVLRDFKVGNHVFKKGTRDSWDQVKLPGTQESMLRTLCVYLEHSYRSPEEEAQIERERQKEADRQLEKLARELAREKEEETRKRLERVRARKEREAAEAKVG